MLCVSAISLMPLSRFAEYSSHPKCTLVLLSIFAAVITACNSFAVDFYTLLWPRVAFSIVSSPISPLNLRIMTNYFNIQKRGIGSGVYFLSVYIGLSFASICLLTSILVGWRITYVCLGLISILISLISGCSISKIAPQKEKSNVQNDLKGLYRSSTLIFCVIGLSFKYISQFTRSSFESLYFSRAFPNNVETYSILNTVSLLICPWSPIVLGKISDNLEPRYPLVKVYMCAISLLLPLPCFVAMYLTSSFELAMACIFLASVISEAYISLSYSIMINVTLPRIRALQTAWMMSITMVAGSIAIVIIGYTYKQLEDLRISLLVATTLPLIISSVFFFLITKTYKKDLLGLENSREIKVNESCLRNEGEY